jgi:asparagine synthase (glutamine-hydrolysing)
MAGIVPDEIIHRPKQGFALPIKKWFKDELREMLVDTLTDRRTRERGYFDHQAVAALIDEHQRGRRDNALQLWGLLTLELWLRTFIDRQPAMRSAGHEGGRPARLTLSAKGGGS